MLTRIHLFFVFLVTPFLAILLAFLSANPFVNIDRETVAEEHSEIQEQNTWVKQYLFEKRELIADTKDSIQVSNELIEFIQTDAEQEFKEYVQQQEKLESLMETSSTYQRNSEDLTEHLLATMLGDPIGQTYGEKSTVKIYSLAEAGYRGYMAKVRLHDPSAIQMVLSGDKIASNGETTSQAAKRSGAILAINAGGFTRQDGKLLPIGITVIDGEIVTFYDTSISFIGFNQKGHLVGGKVSSRKDVEALNVQQGASFTPTLLKDSKKQPIPSSWANTKQPRTLIGHFNNEDLFFMVIDGRREGWSNGVTLEEAQDKLLEFNIREAYNLDGGGSSAFYYNGKILNKPSDGKERKVTTNIVILP